jgi:phosphatidylglycerol:prolipoprotein diacylglycerol transferase
MHPRLLAFDHFVVYSFGAFMVIAFLAALWWLRRTAPLQGIDARLLRALSLWLIAGGLIGAKLFKIGRLLLQQPFSIAALGGAGDFYGGFLGALVVALIYFWRHPELSAWRVADLYGATLPLGQAIGRIGCFMAGDDYGTQTRVPWAVTFTDPEAALVGGAPLGVPLHPVQLYEALVCFGIFLFLIWLTRRKRFEGEIVLAYALCYAVARFILEFFRGDLDRGFLLGGLLSTSQFIALLVGGVSLVIMVRRWSNRDRQTKPEGH